MTNADGTPEHPQVPLPILGVGLVDEDIAFLIDWCLRNGIETEWSCQGDPLPAPQTSPHRAYIAFPTLTDLDRFHRRLMALCSNDLLLLKRLTSDAAMEHAPEEWDREWDWEWEADPSWECRLQQPGAGLRGTVRFLHEDLARIHAVLADAGELEGLDAAVEPPSFRRGGSLKDDLDGYMERHKVHAWFDAPAVEGREPRQLCALCEAGLET